MGDLAGRLARGRELAESLMTSTCRIGRNVGVGQQDEATGRRSIQWQIVYTGKTRVRGQNAGTSPYRPDTPGTVPVNNAVRTIKLPASVTDVRDGDIVEITSGDLTGVFFQLDEAALQDLAVERRIQAVETSRPDDWPQGA